MSSEQPSTSGLQAMGARKYDGLLFVNHMIAGAAAGTMEHTAMYPVDTIKTRMQALSHPGQRLHSVSVYAALKTALKREGVAGLYKGVGAVAAGAGPAHALHFAVYELSKELLGGNKGSGHHPAIAAASGALATVLNEAVMTPVDVVKQRLQVAHSPYTGVMDCIRKTYKAEGLTAFFKSYRTTLLMNIPFQAIHFAVYEGAKKVLLEPVVWHSLGVAPGEVPLDEEALEDSLSTQLVAGGLAGGVAAALTTPMDLVKTRMQTEGVHSKTRHDSTAVIPAMRRIIREEGMASLWRGIKPRVMFNVPAAAVCWGTYETIKSFLAEHE